MITSENCLGCGIETGNLLLPTGAIIRSQISELKIPMMMCFFAMVVVSGCDQRKATPLATSEEVVSQKSIAPQPSPSAITQEREEHYGHEVVPQGWRNLKRQSGSYSNILEYQGLSFQAAEAHKPSESQGASLDGVFAFWLKNQLSVDLKIYKITVFLGGFNQKPISGFDIQPADGAQWIALTSGESHVVPYWFKRNAEVPDSIALLVEREDGQNAVYVMDNLCKMLEGGYDARAAWLKGSKFEGVDRIVHPKFYDIGGGIDTGSGSEVFLGHGTVENVFYDLGHGENWFESRSLDEKSPIIYFRIFPFDPDNLKRRFSNAVSEPPGQPETIQSHMPQKSSSGSSSGGLGQLDHPLRGPLLSFQPLVPGMSWTYKIVKQRKPVEFRRVTYNLMIGSEYVGNDGAGPMNESDDSGDTLRFTVTDQTDLFNGKQEAELFHKIRTEKQTNGNWIPTENGLYWGRVKLDVMSFALCEVRELEPSLRNLDPKMKASLLGNVQGNLGGGTNKLFHARFLAPDATLHRDFPDLVKNDEMMASPLHLRIKNIWDLQAGADFEQVVVPAGTFSVNKTTFTYTLNTDSDVKEELYYAFGVGLVRWTQFRDGILVWKADLIEYAAPKRE